MPDQSARFIVTILGKAGSGKTYLTRETILPAVPRPVFICDPMAEFSTLGLQFDSARDLWGYVTEGRRNDSQVYTLRVTRDGDAEALFRMLTVAKEPCTLIVDEVSNYCSPHKIEESLKRLIAYGRHWGVNIISTARRPAEVHKDVLAQSDAVVTFKQTERRDLKALSYIAEEAEGASDLDYAAHEALILGPTDRLPFGDALEMAARGVATD